MPGVIVIPASCSVPTPTGRLYELTVKHHHGREKQRNEADFPVRATCCLWSSSGQSLDSSLVIVKAIERLYLATARVQRKKLLRKQCRSFSLSSPIQGPYYSRRHGFSFDPAPICLHTSLLLDQSLNDRHCHAHAGLTSQLKPSCRSIALVIFRGWQM